MERLRPKRLWQRMSFSLKLALILLLTGVAAALVPLTTSTDESAKLASSRANDKAALVLNLINGERQSLQSNLQAVVSQIAAGGAGGDLRALRQALIQDSQTDPNRDVLCAFGGGGSVIVRAGSEINDSALLKQLENAAGAGDSIAGPRPGVVWLLESVQLSGATTLVEARPLDADQMVSLTQAIDTGADQSGLAIAHDGIWSVGGRVGTSPVSPGASVDPKIEAAVNTQAPVKLDDGPRMAVGETDLGNGFSAIVTSPIAQTSAPWAPASTFVAVMILAMLSLVLLIQTELVRPLVRLDRAVDRLKKGDFSGEIPNSGENEIGRLGRSFAAMRDTLHGTLRNTMARASISAELASPQPLQNALQKATGILQNATLADTAMIVVAGNEMSDSFVVMSGRKVEGDASELLHEEGPLGVAFRLRDGRAVEVGAGPGSLELQMGFANFLCAPLRIGESCLGVVAIANRNTGFETANREIVEASAEQIALALERYRFLAVVQRQASIDDLTGLHNHRYMVDYLDQQIALAERMSSPLALLMLDIDHFKDLNDTYGHGAGDEALRSFAGVLQTSIRRSDLAARYGGEEFIVVMPDTDRLEAEIVAQKIRTMVEEMKFSIPTLKKPLSITVSIGGAAYPQNTGSAGDLIRIADRSLYIAKNSGRNRVHMSEETIVEMKGAAKARRRKIPAVRHSG